MGAAAASIVDDNATLFVALLTPLTLPVSPRDAASWPGRHSRFWGGPALGASVMARAHTGHAANSACCSGGAPTRQGRICQKPVGLVVAAFFASSVGPGTAPGLSRSHTL